MCTLSKRGPPSTDGSNDSPPAWLTHFTTTQNRIFESFKNDINDRLSKQEQKLKSINQPFSTRSFTSNSSNSAWNSPAQQNFRRSNASGQSSQPSQLDMKSSFSQDLTVDLDVYPSRKTNCPPDNQHATNMESGLTLMRKPPTCTNFLF